MRKYLFDGVRIYSEHDASMTEQARFMMESDSYYSPLTAMRIGNAGVWYYPLYDSLGSTRRLINASQTVTDSYSYDAFGNITSQSGSTYNPYRYVGSLGYWSADTTTGLMHLGARYYNPSHGRFTALDPVGRGSPLARGWDHLYLYCKNRVTKHADPTGLQREDCEIQYTECVKKAGFRQFACHVKWAVGIGFVGSIASAVACIAALSTDNPYLIGLGCPGLPAGATACFMGCWKKCDRDYRDRREKCEREREQCTSRASD